MEFPAQLLLLLALGLLSSGDESYPQISDGGSAKDSPCFQVLPGEEGALNIGQRWEESAPTATLHIDLRNVTSAISTFDFRTLDPEGVIFSGDVGNRSDWFVLGLRRGKAEIQICNIVTNITVRGGRRLNDGHWHKVLVKNEGRGVQLEVDGDETLSLGHVSYPIVERPTSKMRIAVGGLLMPYSNLLTPMNVAMDGCLRSWNWLSQKTTWQEEATLERDSKPCFHTLHPGSFFPGAGLASFWTADFTGGTMPPSDSWELTMEMGLQAPQQTGLLLAVAASNQSVVLSLALQPTAVVARLGNGTELRLSLPAEHCLDALLRLEVSPAHLTLGLGTQEDTRPTHPSDFQQLQGTWLGQGGRLFIGALPGGDKSPWLQELGAFQGCLQEIRVQGQQLDLDTALFKSNSIWAHSCPGGHKGVQAGGQSQS